MSTNPRPTKRLRRATTLSSLPEEVLTQILAILPPKPAFLLSLTNTRFHRLYALTATTIDATAPFRTESLYTHTHVASLLRHTKHLKTLKLSIPLPNFPHPFPLKTLRFDQSHGNTPNPPVLDIPTLRDLHINNPRPQTRFAIRSIVSQLTSLTLTNAPSDDTFLQHLSESLKQSHLHHLTLSLSKATIPSMSALVNVLQSLKEHPTLRTLACGFTTPERVSRSFNQSRQHKLFITISCLLQLLRERPSPTGGNLRKLHIFTPVFSRYLFYRLSQIAADADITYSFEANCVKLPLSGGCVVTELASMPTMRYLTEMDGVTAKIHTFNLALRELATTYMHDYVQGLSGLITHELHTLRVQIPLRSSTNLDPIVNTLSGIMKLSTRVKHLHISREVVHFAEEGLMPSFLEGWGTVEALYLTAPERFPQDPYPERCCRKYSAWRFIIALPTFLEILPRMSPKLNTLILEEIGSMGDVGNPTAMTRFIETALKAVENFEHVLPGVDASTVRAQLLVWRSRFLQEVMACQGFL